MGLAMCKSWTTSVHCAGAIVAQAALVIPKQPRIHAEHMLIARLGERLVRKVHGQIKQSVFHIAMLAGSFAGGNSLCDEFVHSETLNFIGA